jgi:15-cis-phytoene synthase
MARDTNFYYSFLVLTPARRQAIVAVWDFCRAVDDAVDEAKVETEADRAAAHARLDEWRREIARCFAADDPATQPAHTPQTPQTPQGQALVPFIRQFDLPRGPFSDLVDGVAMDIGHRRFKNFAELYQYCYRVASTVGIVCVQIFGCQDAQSRDYAMDLGLALQLTNILRDVKKDLAIGRLYIPLDDMARFAVTEHMLVNDTGSPNVRSLLRAQAVRARDYYARATRAIPPDESRRLIAAEIMSGIYQAILAEIERRDFDVFGETVRVSRPRRAWIAVIIWTRMTFRVKEAFAEVSREVSRRFGGPM